MTETSLLKLLVSRGDQVSVFNGRLQISPASGDSIPPQWMADNSSRIMGEISSVLGLLVLEYCSYRSGAFGSERFPGISLQFVSALDDEDYFAAFNASITRARNTRGGASGKRLPAGHFRVGKQSAFVKFWKRSGLKLPNRLSSFHDYMGKLKRIYFVAEVRKGAKLVNGSIKPLNISVEMMRELTRGVDFTDNSHTICIQATDNIQTTLPDSESAQAEYSSEVHGSSTTSEIYRGERLIGIGGQRGNVIPLIASKLPKDQTVDEWISEYEQSEHYKISD